MLKWWMMNCIQILTGISGPECEWLFSLLDDEDGIVDKRDRNHSELVVQVTKVSDDLPIPIYVLLPLLS